MRLHRWLAASLVAAPLAISGAPAQANVLGCNERSGSDPGTAGSEQTIGGGRSDAPLISMSDSIDIITVNPKLAFALEENSRAETEGDGTSASTGDSGVARSENQDDTEDACVLRSHDFVDVLTINPEISISLDDDPFIFEQNDEDDNAQPTPER